jgi:hypothetical protein
MELSCLYFSFTQHCVDDLTRSLLLQHNFSFYGNYPSTAHLDSSLKYILRQRSGHMEFIWEVIEGSTVKG